MRPHHLSCICARSLLHPHQTAEVIDHADGGGATEKAIQSGEVNDPLADEEVKDGAAIGMAVTALHVTAQRER